MPRLRWAGIANAGTTLCRPRASYGVARQRAQVNHLRVQPHQPPALSRGFSCASGYPHPCSQLNLHCGIAARRNHVRPALRSPLGLVPADA